MPNNIPNAGAKDSKDAKSPFFSVTQERVMAEKARKDREDKKRKLGLQRDDLKLKENDLRAQEEKYSSLRREITKLENQPQKSTTITSGTVLNIQVFEREGAAKISTNENKIKTLEQEVGRLKRENKELDQDLEFKKQDVEKAKKDFAGIKQQVEEHQKSLQEKTQEAVLAVNRINALKEEIKMIQARIQALQR
jgi:chromosome segregation ATPase